MSDDLLHKHVTEEELCELFQSMMPNRIGVQKVEFGQNDSAYIYFDDIAVCNRVQFVLQKHIPFEQYGPAFFSFQDRDTVATVLYMFKDQIARQIQKEFDNHKAVEIMDPKD